LVDDTALIRHLARDVLTEAGFEVHAAADGSAALEFLRARARPIDVVITDLSMPRMDGLELMREVRRIAPRTRVVLMTGFLDGDNLAARADERPDLVLNKPFRPPELLDAVREALTLDRNR
jgi:CheY-like chemotaxis protein